MISTISAIVATMASALLPIIVVLILYPVKNTWARVCVVIGFIAADAIFANFLTTAGRREIFTTTAA
jgi:hypothetical protein